MKFLTTYMGVVSILVLHTLSLNAQVFTIKPGKWSSPSTWSNGIIPDATTSHIRVLHDVLIPDDTTLSVDNITIEAGLTIAKHGTLILSHDHVASADLTLTTGTLTVLGELVCRDSATFFGTTTANTFFRDSAIYEHQYFNTAGEPPLANWAPTSTLLITGYVFGKSLNSAKWNQFYGNVIYDCAAQRSGSFVEMLGNIQQVAGHFIVRNTNGGVLRFSLDKTALTNIHIGGDFIIEGRSEFWLGRNSTIALQVDGDFLFRATATASTYLTTTGRSEVTVDGSVHINSTAPLRFASSGGGTGILRVKKNFMLESGTITVLPIGTGQLIFEGVHEHTFHAAGNLTSGIDVILNDSSNVVITNNTKIGGNLIVRQASRLTLPFNCALEGNLEIENTGDLVAHSGTLQLTGNASQFLNINADTVRNLSVDKASNGSVSLTGKLNLLGNLVIKSVGTHLHSNGHLNLLSLSDDGINDAAINVLPSGSTITGNVVVQRYMSGEGKIYRYLSSPIQMATVADCKDDFPVTGTFDDPSNGGGIATASPSLFHYDETLLNNEGWINYPSSGLAAQNALQPGKGYTAYIRKAATATTWDVTGIVNQHDITFPITYTPSGDLLNDGWNLIGNPYPSNILWSAINGWEKFNVADKVVVKDNGAGIFRYWSEGIGNLDEGRIAKGQAFWVQTIGADPTLKITENAKSPLSTAFHRRQIPNADYLALTLKHNDVEDRAYIRQKAGTRIGRDESDLLKWINDNFNIALVADSFKLAVQNLEQLSCGQPIPLEIFFTRGANGQWNTSPIGEYTVQSISHGTFNQSQISLLDHFTNKTISLSDGYTFSVSQDELSYSPARFSLMVTTQTQLHDVDVITQEFLCATSPPLIVALQKLQLGVTYEVWWNNQLVESYHAMDVNHIFSLESDVPHKEENVMEIKARTVCQYMTLHSVSIPYVEKPLAPVIMEKDRVLQIETQGKVKWFLEGELLTGDTSLLYAPLRPGAYQAEVNRNGCITRSHYTFYGRDNIVRCYPIPADDELNVVPPNDEKIYDVTLTDISGRRVVVESQHDEVVYTLFTGALETGLYTLCVTTDSGQTKLKMLKR